MKFNVVFGTVSVKLADNLTVDIAYWMKTVNAGIVKVRDVVSSIFGFLLTGEYLIAKVNLDTVVGCAAKPHTHVVFTAFIHNHSKRQLCIFAADRLCGHRSPIKIELARIQTES